MPNYEFRCEDCKKKYTLMMSVKEREKGKPKCPKCGSKKSQPIIGSFFAKTSRKS